MDGAERRGRRAQLLERARELRMEARALSLEARGLPRQEQQTDTGRLAEMVRMRSERMTLQQIGDHFAITRERVRQLLKRAGSRGRLGPTPCRGCGCGVTHNEYCQSCRRRIDRFGSPAKRYAEDGWIPGLPIAYCDRIVPEPNSGCWLWTGSTTVGGYAHTSRGAGHRVVYKAVVGPIPRGHHLHHVCEVPSCCNPDHMRLLTAAEHARHHRAIEAAEGRGWHAAARSGRRFVSKAALCAVLRGASRKRALSALGLGMPGLKARLYHRVGWRLAEVRAVIRIVRESLPGARARDLFESRHSD